MSSVSAATSEAVSITYMTEHDLLEVVEIEEHSGLSRWGWSAYYAELQGQNRQLMLVARTTRSSEQSGTVAGYIVARLNAGELHINNVAVREEYRQQGIGAELLRRIIAEGRQSGASGAFLEVRAGNSAAQTLYKKCGLRTIGRRRNYYSEPNEDALVMSLALR